ncbi:MAG: hypothetical protein A3F78_11290 [Burkholderiales bacterium RIFCSPLOWO2_12_FULL_61_40]|nr:MAG: hypothetical protein A3F78_11290 [Burkholderiales bacterium RIFCSPLOWO2_12_FULL_61_40]
MNTLHAELNRLYLCGAPGGTDPDKEAPGLVAPDGRVRALVLALARPADWNALSTVWQGVQTDLELPAPAIAVNGIDGYQLWFSLGEPVPAAQAQAFLEALRLRYLGRVAPQRVGTMPAVDVSAPGKIQHAPLVPTLQQGTGRWSAFVAPDLAAIFSEEPWLDVRPSPEAQATVLSRLACTQPAAFQAAMASITEKNVGNPEHHAVAGPAPIGKSLDPKRFLLDVMGDPSIALHLRMEAAKALLPYCEGNLDGKSGS